MSRHRTWFTSKSDRPWADGKSIGSGVKRSRRPAPPGRFLVLLAVLVVAAAACRVPFLQSREELPAEALAAYERGLDLESTGDADAALAAFRTAVGRAPEFIDAHRALQNLRLGRYERGRLIDEYRLFLAAAPDSAARRYLLARLWSDPVRQLEGFEAALASDPSLYFGYVGVGYVSLEQGVRERAEWALRRALRLCPEKPEAAHGLLRALAVAGEPGRLEEQAEIATTLLERDPTDALAKRALLTRDLAAGNAAAAVRDAVRFALESTDPEAANLAFELLSTAGAPPEFDLARALLPASAAAAGESAEWVRLRALIEERAGDPWAALQTIERAAPVVERLESIGVIRRRLLLSCGQLTAYLDEVHRRRYDSGYDLGDGGAAQRELDAVRELLAPGIPTGLEAERAMRSLLSLGLVEAAITFARLAAADPAADGVLRLLDDALRYRRFVAQLNEYFTRLYREDDAVALEQVLLDLRELSVEILGEDVVEPAVTREYFPVGTFLDPDPASGCGLARYFDRFGTLFLVGKQTFGVPEAYVLPRIAQARPQVAGRPIYRVVGESLLVPSRTEFQGGEIAGFAFETFIVLNVDRVRTSAMLARVLREELAADASALLDDALLAAKSRSERIDVSEPLTLRARAMYRSIDTFLAAGGRPGHYAGLLLDAVEAHERAHIRDAARFLPLFSDVGAKLSLLWDLGFSPARVEAWLEQRAQAAAFAAARSPLAVLAATATLLPERRDATLPHSSGYSDLVLRLVTEIEEHAERYPEIDRAYSILPQLDRLGEEGLRRLARRVLADDAVPAAAR